MNYNVISNDPIKRRKSLFTYVSWEGAFNNEEIENIKATCEKEPLNDAVTVGDKTKEENEKHRKSKIRFIGRQCDTGWIFDRFNNVITSINNDFYGFNLNGYSSFQYTVYNSDVNGMYNWHMDTIMGHVTDSNFDEIRKLTLVMLLSEPTTEFTGGEFQMNRGNEDDAETINFVKGTIVAFPSFMIHRVKPVLLGTRKSIVLWVEGPKFV